MPVFKKGAGLLRVSYRTQLKTAPKKVSMIGKYYPFNDGVDLYQSVEVEGLPATPTEKEFLEGNPDRLSYYVPRDISSIIPPLGVLFPNCTLYVVGNTEQVVSGLPDADAVAIVPNTFKSSYLADPVYSTYQNLTFDSWILQNETTIPFVGNTTLTASFVRLFYENAGGIASTVGKIIVAPEYTDFETGVFDLIFALFVNCEEIEYGGLPSAYQEVECIEGASGTEINTGAYATNATKVILSISDLPSGDYNIFRAYTDWGSRMFSARHANDGRFWAYFGTQYSSGGTFSENTSYEITLDATGGYIDGQRKITFDPEPSFTSQLPILFVCACKLRSFTIYENSILVRDLVPCYRKSDGEIGLYDTVNDVFYTNSGTGVFTKGSNVQSSTIITRPALATATIVGSGTLTAQKVADTLTAYPEFASAEKIIVPVEFDQIEASALDEILDQFPNVEYVARPNGVDSSVSGLQTPIVQDFADIPWDNLRFLGDLGIASQYFDLGDTKTDTDTNSVTHTYRIVQFGYEGKSILLEDLNPLQGSSAWNESTNVDSDGNSANYSISKIRNVTLPAIFETYPSSLKTVIETTSYYVAKSVQNNTDVLILQDKLFLGARKEYFGDGGQQGEASHVSQLALYAQNNTDAFRIKYKANGDAGNYWTRSCFVPGYGQLANRVINTGSYGNNGVTAGEYFSPLFTIGTLPQQP